MAKSTAKASTTQAPGRAVVWGMVAALVVLTLILTALRNWVSDDVSAASGDHLWELRVKARVEQTVAGALASVAIPLPTDHLRVIAHQTSYKGWMQRFGVAGQAKGARRMHLAAISGGNGEFETVFTIQQYATPRIRPPVLQAGLPADLRETFLASNPLLGLDHELVQSEVVVLNTGSQSKAELMHRIAVRAQQLLPGTSEDARPVPEVLLSGHAAPLERCRLMIALSRASNIPARLVTGVVLREDAPNALSHWVELYDDDAGWVAYDPVHGFQRGVPQDFLPIARGASDIVNLSQGHLDVSLVVANTDELLEVKNIEELGWTSLFYLTRLPLETRESLALMLLMPLSVLLSMAFREFTGVHSYGVFTPTLFALVLTRAPWQSAAALLALVLLFGVIGRQALPASLKRSPRLTLVITLVSLGTVAGISLMDYLAMNPDGQVLLLSIVILATMVDRVYRTLDTEGLDSVISRLGWTLFQTVFLCLPVMQLEGLGSLLVERPELHLLTLAAVLLATNHRGCYLCEQPRMRWMCWPQKKAAGRSAD